MRRFRPGRRLVGLAISFLVLSLGLWFLAGRPSVPADSRASLRVLTYSSFMNSWGPGPEIAKLFEAKTGVPVEFQDAGDAGLILEKLKLFPVDVVVGLDGFSLQRAKNVTEWKSIPKHACAPDLCASDLDFTPVDYAPIAFVYRKGEIEPPTSLDDLLDTRFSGQIALQDPRMSTPGLHFLFWVLDEKGVEGGFEYLAKLQKNVYAVFPNWSGAYGAFKKNQTKLVLSFSTSPLYHVLAENDEGYAAAVFNGGHPLQVEYAGIPDGCARCEDAQKFISFLESVEVQKIIMQKNFMMPSNLKAAKGTPFESIENIRIRPLTSSADLMNRRDEIFERWRKLGL